MIYRPTFPIPLPHAKLRFLEMRSHKALGTTLKKSHIVIGYQFQFSTYGHKDGQ